MGMMNAIHKRYRGSELDEILLISDVAVAGSVDQALKRKHQRGLRYLKAWYECLKNKSVHLPYDVHEKLYILRTSESSIEKECSHEELMDFNKINDLTTGIFSSVIMSCMAEYWKVF